MAKLELKSVIPVNNYTSIHPAIDFYDGTAIISVGCKWQEVYDVLDKRGNVTGEEVKFVTTPYCILSNGQKFRYSKRELSNRNLFYSGRIELPEQSRWAFEDINDWSDNPKSLTIEQMYKVIRNEFEYYVDYSNDTYYDLLACFVIYTYFYPLFYNAPVIQFWGEMRTGKTKSLSLLDVMVLNPINSANISSASVFRLIEARRATILFDESEDLMTSDRSREIRNMLLAGTGKSGETYRQEKATDDTYKTQVFKVFSPKVIAHISGIDMPALLSRVIRVGTVASKNKDKQNRCVEPEDTKWQKIRNQLYRLCLCRYQEVIEARDNLNNQELIGRTLYIWQGIITIAKLADKKVHDRLVELAKQNKDELESEIEEYNDEPQKLVEHILNTFDLELQSYYSPDALFARLSQYFDLSSKRDMGFKLGKLGIRSKTLTVDGKFGRYYHLSTDKLKYLLKS